MPMHKTLALTSNSTPERSTTHNNQEAKQYSFTFFYPRPDDFHFTNSIFGQLQWSDSLTRIPASLGLNIRVNPSHISADCQQREGSTLDPNLSAIKRVKQTNLCCLELGLPLLRLLALNIALQVDHGQQQDHSTATGCDEGCEVGVPTIVLHDDGQWHAGIGRSQIGDPSQEALGSSHRLGTHLDRNKKSPGQKKFDPALKLNNYLSRTPNKILFPIF